MQNNTHRVIPSRNQVETRRRLADSALVANAARQEPTTQYQLDCDLELPHKPFRPGKQQIMLAGGAAYHGEADLLRDFVAHAG